MVLPLDYQKLALKWAPVNYQYINLDEKCNYHAIKQDLLCQVNFESTSKHSIWDTAKVDERLENTDIEKLIPTAYYSVAETVNHYFILYAYYHALDASHINDMEGCLIILEKQDNEDKQLLLGMITIAHYDFWYYVYEKRLAVKNGISTSGPMEIDEEFDYGHPLIQQEDRKHGLYALGTHIEWFTKLWRWFLAIINCPPDIIVYYPNTTPSEYSLKSLTKGKKTPYDPAFYYKLIDILDKENGLWEKRLNSTSEPFGPDGRFGGGAANPPWQWKPGFNPNEPKKPTIEIIWQDPQKLVSDSFEKRDGGKDLDSEYIRYMDGTLNKR